MLGIDLAGVTTVLHLCAPNDRNGNPNRAYVAFQGHALRGFWPEGYSGCHAVPDQLRELASFAPRINVSARELRSWRKAAADLCPDLCN
jgi:hypothetical protein